MIAQQGDYIATYRVLHPKAGGESKYESEIELWEFDASAKLRRVRSLGTHWWDGGSTGDPSILAVAGSGVAVVDAPSGGGAWQSPVAVGLDGIPQNISQSLGWLLVFDGVPLAFDEGIVCPVWALDRLAYDELAHNWLAWIDGKSTRLWRAPSGFLNIWRKSPTVLGVSIRNGKTIEFRTIELPPKNWWSPPLAKTRGR